MPSSYQGRLRRDSASAGLTRAASNSGSFLSWDMGYALSQRENSCRWSITGPRASAGM